MPKNRVFLRNRESSERRQNAPQMKQTGTHFKSWICSPISLVSRDSQYFDARVAQQVALLTPQHYSLALDIGNDLVTQLPCGFLHGW
jgi:hypothetical protein